MGKHFTEPDTGHRSRAFGEAQRRPFGMQAILDPDVVRALDRRRVQRREIGLQRLGEAIETHLCREVGLHAICGPVSILFMRPDPLAQAAFLEAFAIGNGKNYHSALSRKSRGATHR